jgi:protein-disulfide isomerase
MSSIQPYLTPIAVIVGCCVIAVALVFADFSGSNPAPSPRAAAPTAPTPAVFENVAVFRTESRHVYGNPDAKITIVEFSDFECPFCARLHPTLKQLVDQSNGEINWEYRHLPLPNHVNARPAAIASECVARHAGNDAFWSYSDLILKNIGQANADFLRREALARGVTSEQYDSCITDPAMAALVDADAAVPAQYGGTGTPFSIVVDNSTQTGRPVSGAVPLPEWQRIIAAINES